MVRKVLVFLTSRRNSSFAECILFFLPIYFLFRPYLGEQTVTVLLGAVFSPPVAVGVKWFILLYACVTKIAVHFKPRHETTIEDDSLCRGKALAILTHQNDEIESHIKALEKRGVITKEQFEDLHRYTENIKLILANLIDLLVRHFKEVELKESDIFVSFYEKSDDALAYVCHFDGTRHPTSTLEIPLNDLRYACVKSYQSGEHVMLHDAANSSEYWKGESSERRQSIKQFYCLPIRISGTVEGVVNIEIHRISIFKNKVSMKSFLSEYLTTFRSLVRYQVLKKSFFKRVVDCGGC